MIVWFVGKINYLMHVSVFCTRITNIDTIRKLATIQFTNIAKIHTFAIIYIQNNIEINICICKLANAYAIRANRCKNYAFTRTFVDASNVIIAKYNKPFRKFANSLPLSIVTTAREWSETILSNFNLKQDNFASRD